MRKYLYLGAWLPALILILAGCARSSRQGILFQDSFDNPRSGWGKDQREQFERGYRNGEYSIELRTPNWFVWAHPAGKFTDVSVEVNARLASGAPDGHFGVLCRYVDAENFYYFGVSADGYYAIFRRTGENVKILTGDGSGMLPSPAIRTGERNHIRAVCQGDSLSLYVNDEMIATASDRTLTRGYVGLGAGSGPGGSTLIQFDDFVVTAP